jgi:hypothetical protein
MIDNGKQQNALFYPQIPSKLGYPDATLSSPVNDVEVPVFFNRSCQSSFTIP